MKDAWIIVGVALGFLMIGISIGFRIGVWYINATDKQAMRRMMGYE